MGYHTPPYQSNCGCPHKTVYVAAHKELPREPVRNTEAPPLARVFKFFIIVGGNALSYTCSKKEKKGIKLISHEVRLEWNHFIGLLLVPYLA